MHEWCLFDVKKFSMFSWSVLPLCHSIFGLSICFYSPRSVLEQDHLISSDPSSDLRSLAVVLCGSGFTENEYIVQPSGNGHLHNPGIGQASVDCQFVDPSNDHFLALSRNQAD